MLLRNCRATRKSRCSMNRCRSRTCRRSSSQAPAERSRENLPPTRSIERDRSSTARRPPRAVKRRLAIVRQRYTPFGGEEVFVERAIAALRERGVDITVVTREWPGGARGNMEVVKVDPFHAGRTSRQAGFERAVCARLAREPNTLVQSHERIPCCDIYRAGDGVHAVWLEEKTRGAHQLVRALTYADPFHRYMLDAERRLYSSPRLKAVICISRMVQDEVHTRFGVARERLPIIYNAIDHEVFSPALARHRAEV